MSSCFSISLTFCCFMCLKAARSFCFLLAATKRKFSGDRIKCCRVETVAFVWIFRWLRCNLRAIVLRWELIKAPCSVTPCGKICMCTWVFCSFVVAHTLVFFHPQRLGPPKDNWPRWTRSWTSCSLTWPNSRPMSTLLKIASVPRLTSQTAMAAMLYHRCCNNSRWTHLPSL